MTWYCEICGYKILSNRKFFGELCVFCHEAYLRGREDAAKAVRSMWVFSDSQIPNKTGLIRKITIFEAERIALNMDASELTQHYMDICREERR